jgi:sulfur relay (sulfurtransferase) complex TusBCD TusD component (DsrE family)
VKLAFVVQTEPYKFEAVDTLLNMVAAAKRAHHQVLGVFFFGSGVYSLQKEIDPGATVRNLVDRIKSELADSGIALVGCTTWMGMDGISKNNMMEGAKDEGLGTLTQIATEADKLIFFGPGV